MCESHFCSLKAYFSLHYCIISNFNFQHFFFVLACPFCSFFFLLSMHLPLKWFTQMYRHYWMWDWYRYIAHMWSSRFENQTAKICLDFIEIYQIYENFLLCTMYVRGCMQFDSTYLKVKEVLKTNHMDKQNKSLKTSLKISDFCAFHVIFDTWQSVQIGAELGIFVFF